MSEQTNLSERSAKTIHPIKNPTINIELATAVYQVP